MVQDVEDLRPELNVESLRNAMNREVLGRGEIQVYKFWSNDGIATRIAQEIRTILDAYQPERLRFRWYNPRAHAHVRRRKVT